MRKLQADLRVLEADRKQQFEDKDFRLKENAKLERAEYLRVVERQREQEEEEKRLAAMRRDAYLKYKTDLRKQMVTNDEVRQTMKHEQVIEGKKARLLVDMERQRIEQIKIQKIQETKHYGIDDKHMKELARHKVSF